MAWSDEARQAAKAAKSSAAVGRKSVGASYKSGFKDFMAKREADIKKKSAAALRSRKAENAHNPNADFGTLKSKSYWEK